HQLAREVAGECIVLLKNEDNILPFKKNGAIALIGGFAKISRYQGGGSSHINPTKIDNTYDEMIKITGNKVRIRYAQGYPIDSDEMDESLIDEAKETAKNTDVAVVFVGLPDRYESEGYDRNHMDIPENHKNLIEAVAEVQKNIVVVLSNGAPIEMPWIDKVKGIIEGYLGGQAVGGAIADVLFGITNPCGKLTETFPMKLSHNSSYINFPGEEDKVEYKEGLFVGYRYYDAKGIEPLFPFGHGLSYTNFEYADISVDKNEIKDTDTITVKVKVKNTGRIVGKEIIQLYIRDIESSVIRPLKELKGFEKVELQPGEEKELSFILDKRSFAYYNVDIKDWHVESGDFEILIGKSSKEIVLRKTINIQSTVNLRKKFHRNSTVGDLMNDPKGKMIIEKTIQQLKQQDGMSFDLSQMENSEMGKALMRYMPLRGLINFSNGAFSEEMLENLIVELNNSEKQMFNKKEESEDEKR
ncbi:MAG TPA: glycoside hydrolase family 3 C-terminal domain-containing protein, partial [Atribacterota bacterium]|nr:glycoside hydrolase family 3 C-terminal domain-containing protein [Atribacterota bacterium]